jgi:hypothetical protein
VVTKEDTPHKVNTASLLTGRHKVNHNTVADLQDPKALTVLSALTASVG